MARPLAVDWEDLGMALATNPAARSGHLDTRTGEVLLVPVDRLGDDDGWPSGDEIDAGLDAGHLLAIEPLGSPVEHGWMAPSLPRRSATPGSVSSWSSPVRPRRLPPVQERPARLPR